MENNISQYNGEIVNTPPGMLPYKEEFAFDMIAYFRGRPLYEEKTKTMTWKDGSVKEEVEEVPGSMPTFEEYAMQLGVSVKTLKKWARVYPEFREAAEMCQDIMKRFFVEHGLKGNFNPLSMKFIATNITDWKDKSENIQKTVDVNKYIEQIEKNTKPLFDEEDEEI